ncbi:hypothetical protein ACC685_39435, partial [Rhizobium ruizarguesonis]
ALEFGLSTDRQLHDDGRCTETGLDHLDGAAEQVTSLQGNDKIAISSVVSVENKYLWFRCSKAPFDNPLIRKAACHA